MYRSTLSPLTKDKNMQRGCKNTNAETTDTKDIIQKRSEEHAHAHNAHDAVENKTSYLQPSQTPTATMNTRVKKKKKTLESCISFWPPQPARPNENRENRENRRGSEESNRP